MATIAGASVHHLLGALGALGLDRDALRPAIGIEPSTLLSRGARVPMQDALALFQLAARLGGDPMIGLHAAEASVSRGLLTVLAISQPTVEEALVQFDRFETLLVDDLDATLEPGRGNTVVRIALGSTSGSGEHHFREYLAASVVIELGLATRGRFRPREVRFPHAAGGAVAEYERVLRGSVRFRQPHFEIVIATDLLQERLRTRSPEVARVLEDEARQDLELVTSSQFSARVTSTVHEALARGEETAPAMIATQLGVSTRTLQRRLATEQTSFRAVRNDALRQRALERLGESDVSISQLSDELGFGTVAAFSKAFKRWTGATPSEHRLQARGHEKTPEHA